MTQFENLLGPQATLLPARPAEQAEADAGVDPVELAKKYPDFSAAWAQLAERALVAHDPVAAYAYARTGYHRGLDQLRRAGWRGHGPIPWKHQPNQGFLRSLAALALAARKIGETEEYQRCRQFLEDSDPAALSATGLTEDH